MSKSPKTISLILLSVILFAGIVNWFSYQFFPHYAGPITATLVVIWCTLILRKYDEKWADYGLTKVKSPIRLLWQVPLVLVLTIAAGVLANFLFSSLFETNPVSQSRFEGMEGNLVLFLMWVAIGWMVGGFFEEMIFRGFLLNHFEQLFGKTNRATFMAICSQAFLFGLIHFYNRGWAGGFTIFVVALVMGLLYIRLGRNLWPLILAHGIVDTLSFLEDYLGG